MAVFGVITWGLGMPYAWFKQNQYVINHHRFRRTLASTTARSEDFYVILSCRQSREDAADSDAEPADNYAASNPDQPDDHSDAGNQQTNAENQWADTDNQWAESVLDYFSTHPATAERVNNIRASAQR